MTLDNLSFTLPDEQKKELEALNQNMRNWFVVGLAANPDQEIEGYYGTLTKAERDELSLALLNWDKSDESGQPVTAQSLADDVIAAINEGSELDNPNRFIKSSFALSLLWVAKFYSSIYSQFMFSQSRKGREAFSLHWETAYNFASFFKRTSRIDHDFPNTTRFLQTNY